MATIITLIRPKPLLQPSIRLAPLRDELSKPIDLYFEDCIDDYDRSAVDHAVQVRRLFSQGQVMVAFALPAAAESIIKECLLRGADCLLRIPVEPLDLENPAAMLLTLAAALRPIDYDLILMAHPEFSDDLGDQCRTLASLLRLRYFPRSRITATSGDGTMQIRIHDKLGEWRETTAALPCIVSVSSEPPKILGIRNLKQHLKKPITVLPTIPISRHSPWLLSKSSRSESYLSLEGLADLVPDRSLWSPSMRLCYRPLTPDLPLLPQIRSGGFEFDQRLQRVFALACEQSRSTPEGGLPAAFEDSEGNFVDATAGSFSGYGMEGPKHTKFTGIRDSFLIPFFLATEPAIGERLFSSEIKFDRIQREFDYLRSLAKYLPSGKSPIEEEAAGKATTRVFSRALYHTARRRSHTVRWQDLLLASLELGNSMLDDWRERPMFMDWIVEQALGDPLPAQMPKDQMRHILRHLRINQPRFDGDFQFLITLQDRKPVFRICSPLGDYSQESDAAEIVNRKALLLHYHNRYWDFSPEQIDELNELLQSDVSKELDFQKFFEKYPQFLRHFDYREVYPQVVLTRGYANNLIPDFILTDRRAQRAMILELKRPQTRVAIHQENRLRFSATVMEARAQLQTYKEWFLSRTNRRYLESLLGMKLYEPRLAVVIGRSSEFRTPFERRVISRRTSDIEVVSYDDILRHAASTLNLIRRIWERPLEEHDRGSTKPKI